MQINVSASRGRVGRRRAASRRARPRSPRPASPQGPRQRVAARLQSTVRQSKSARRLWSQEERAGVAAQSYARQTRGVSDLEAIGGDLGDAIERVRVPAYVIDPHGIIRWLNPAARKLVGDVRGRHLTSVVAPEETRRAQEIFTRNLFGPPSGSDNKAVAIGADGQRLSIEVRAGPRRDGGRAVGAFGQVLDVAEEEPPPPPPRLTPRQTEVLRLLERGRSTEQMARELQLSIETVRNHVRGVLHALDAESRLEAVAIARRSYATADATL